MFHGSSPFFTSLGEGSSFQISKRGKTGGVETRQGFTWGEDPNPGGWVGVMVI